MLNFFKKKSIKKTIEIHLENLSKEIFIKEYYIPRIPLIIKGGAKEWPLINKWSEEYIIKTSGNYICNIVDDARPAYSKEKTSLKNYFEKYKHLSTLTLEDFDKKKKPTFLNDMKIPNLFFNEKDIYRFFFYYSNKNQGTLPHNHGDAFNILQSGKKHWLFFDADQKESLKGYKEMMDGFKKFGKGSSIEKYFQKELKNLNKKVNDLSEGIQEKGDIVFIPKKCCHAVLNIENVMGAVFETKPFKYS